MNRREFFSFQFQKSKELGAEYVSEKFEPFLQSLDLWNERQWLEVTKLPTDSAPVYVHTGQHMIAVMQGDEVKAFDATCPECHCQLFWQREKMNFQCPSCLKIFSETGNGDDNSLNPIQAWPVTQKNGKIYIKKGNI